MSIVPKLRPDWNNLDVLHHNTCSPRSNFYLYNTEADALKGNISNAKVQCLSGKWKFHFSESPYGGPEKFYLPGFDDSDFGDIVVPGLWQLQGYGKGPHYTNYMFPWPVDPPNIPLDENECGRYLTKFTVNESFDGHALRLRFEGVDSAFHVWINGEYVGYSQGSRNPSEFLVSHYLNTGKENTLAVAVYQRCDGSYLEDQDQWWFSGIFRDVYLHAFPAVHPTDLQVISTLDDENKQATLKIRVDMNTSAKVELKLLDAHEKELARETGFIDNVGHFEIPVRNPKLWTAETPYLYNLVINLPESSLAQRVGIRTTGLIGGVFCVNGKPIKLRGVNRHEHHPDYGRAVPYEFMKRDLLLMKSHNINAIRTCHQPSDPRLYDLADELGLWIMDEADLECHGFELVGGNAASYTSDNPEWKDAYEDRARQMVARDKNHASVFMWSLGNEAFYGSNHQAMFDLILKMDPTRLVHYEGDQSANTVDVFSRMYPSIDYLVEDFAKEEKWSKPLVVCEFLHAMGNSCGNAKEYVDAFYKWPRLMGGFVWEWANHGLRTKSEEGEEYMGYGGDFSDQPNDGNFILDGMIWSRHEPFSNLVEYAKAIEPIQTLSLDGNRVTIINRYDFIGLEHLECNWQIIEDGKKIQGGTATLPTGIKPHQTAVLVIQQLTNSFVQSIKQEAYLRITYTLKHQTSWAPAGHQVAFGEISIHQPISLDNLMQISSPYLRPRTRKTDTDQLFISSASESVTWRINLRTGLLDGWRNKSGTELLSEPMKLDFFRARTDNDRGGHGGNWIDRRLHQTRHHLKQIKWQELSTGFRVEVHGRMAPPVLGWSVDVVSTYIFQGDSMLLKVHGKPQGQLLPDTFARIGITTSLNGVETAKWWGRGPGESYCDKKLSQPFGNYEATIDELWVDYEFPQDGGNRTDVRRVEFLNRDGRVLRAQFGNQEGASFSASHYSTQDVDESNHPYELHRKKRTDTVVKLDWAHHGQGGGSCGPWTLDKYSLKASNEFNFSLLLD